MEAVHLVNLTVDCSCAPGGRAGAAGGGAATADAAHSKPGEAAGAGPRARGAARLRRSKGGPPDLLAFCVDTYRSSASGWHDLYGHCLASQAFCSSLFCLPWCFFLLRPLTHPACTLPRSSSQAGLTWWRSTSGLWTLRTSSATPRAWTSTATWSSTTWAGTRSRRAAARPLHLQSSCCIKQAGEGLIRCFADA